MICNLESNPLKFWLGDADSSLRYKNISQNIKTRLSLELSLIDYCENDPGNPVLISVLKAALRLTNALEPNQTVELSENYYANTRDAIHCIYNSRLLKRLRRSPNVAILLAAGADPSGIYDQGSG